MGQTLTADTSDLGGSGIIAFQWMCGGNIVIGTNNCAYVAHDDDVGKTITVTVTRSDNTGSITSDPTASVIAGISELTGTVNITGIAQVGQTLTADTSALGGSGNISYQWKRNGTNIETNNSTHTVKTEDLGSTITVTVTRSGNSGSVTSNPTAAVILPALTGTVSITGIAQVGQTLTANTGSLGGSGVITFQWMRDAVVIGSNSNIYTVQIDDVGSVITVTVIRSDNSGSVISEPTAEVPPALTGTVSITGTALMGQTLTANTNALDSTGTISYQWKRDGTNAGSNSNT